jgi:hypothetical protein
MERGMTVGRFDRKGGLTDYVHPPVPCCWTNKTVSGPQYSVHRQLTAPDWTQMRLGFLLSSGGHAALRHQQQLADGSNVPALQVTAWGRAAEDRVRSLQPGLDSFWGTERFQQQGV